MSLPNDWDGFEKLMHHTLYNELRVAPEEGALMLVVPPGNGPEWNASLQKMVQVGFETFSVPAMAVVSAPVAALAAAGRMTGVVVDIGERSVSVTPVFECLAVAESVVSIALGGADVTDYLMKIMTERGYSFTTTAEREIIRDIKEKHAYVALDFEAELAGAEGNAAATCSYELPDGQVVELDTEAFRAPEILFCPSFAGLDDAISLPDAVLLAVMGVEPELRRTMLSNITVVGGSANIPGLCERLELDLATLLPEGIDIHIVSSEPRYATWIGGSILGSLSTTATLLITREEYDAYGPRLASRFVL